MKNIKVLWKSTGGSRNSLSVTEKKKVLKNLYVADRVFDSYYILFPPSKSSNKEVIIVSKKLKLVKSTPVIIFGNVHYMQWD